LIIRTHTGQFNSLLGDEDDDDDVDDDDEDAAAAAAAAPSAECTEPEVVVNPRRSNPAHKSSPHKDAGGCMEVGIRECAPGKKQSRSTERSVEFVIFETKIW
jgi:hypothetical protein